MRTSGPTARRWVVALTLATALAPVLDGCALLPSDPAPPTGVRLNDDGTVDFVSCRPLTGVTSLEGSTFLRTGWNQTIDDKSEVKLTVDTPQVDTLAIGQVVTFLGIPARWASMYLSARQVSSAAIQNGELKVGQWTWYGFVHTKRCLAGEPY